MQERIKREMVAFRENAEEMKRLKETEERRFNEMMEELNEQKVKILQGEKCKLKAAKDELFRVSTNFLSA